MDSADPRKRPPCRNRTRRHARTTNAVPECSLHSFPRRIRFARLRLYVQIGRDTSNLYIQVSAIRSREHRATAWDVPDHSLVAEASACKGSIGRAPQRPVSGMLVSRTARSGGRGCCGAASDIAPQISRSRFQPLPGVVCRPDAVARSHETPSPATAGEGGGEGRRNSDVVRICSSTATVCVKISLSQNRITTKPRLQRNASREAS